MDHLTNVYKHKCEQLQEQLNHLTRMLNEEKMPPIRPLVNSMIRMISRLVNGIDDLNLSATQLSDFAARLRQFMNIHPRDIADLLGAESPQFREYVKYYYGTVMHQNGSWQRQLPNGRIQHWHYDGWIDVTKPGTGTLFGPLGDDLIPILPRVTLDDTLGARLPGTGGLARDSGTLPGQNQV
jgi:hypothetical protein